MFNMKRYLFNRSAFYTVRPVLRPGSVSASSCLYRALSAAADMCQYAHCLLPAHYAMTLFPLAAVAFHISL